MPRIFPRGLRISQGPKSKLWAITKWESKWLLFNKRYTVGVLLVSLLLSLLVPIFLNFVDAFQRGEIVTLSPVLSEFVPISLIGDGKIADEMRLSTLFDFYNLSLEDANASMQARKIAGIVIVSGGNVTLVYDTGNPKRELLIDEVRYRISVAGSKNRSLYNFSIGYTGGGEKPMIGFGAVVNGLLVPSLLLLPLFMWSGALIESIINEKEKKTIESILAGPIKPRDILLGKFLSVTLLTSIMSAVWIALTSFEGIVFGNIAGTYLILVLSGAFICSVVSAVTCASKDFKEAGINVTIATMLVFTLFAMLTLTLYFPKIKVISELSPLGVLARFVSGESYFPTFVVFLLLLLTALFLLISISLFEDEDTFFGKITLRKVYANTAQYIVRPLGEKYSWAAFIIIGFGSAILAGMVESMVLSALIFSIGVYSVYPVIILVPFIEEFCKLYPSFPLFSKKKGRAFLEGVANGFGFNLAESTILGVIMLALVPGFLSYIFTRSLITAIAHSIFTGAGAYIYATTKSRELGIASAGIIHLVYNSVILWLGL
jgi:ABC-type Na+ efflux pump permease subunit